ncbi:MAG: hypothetical protein RL235_1082 [Chlamydiota bacterium]|jgi:hypothetical protein
MSAASPIAGFGTRPTPLEGQELGHVNSHLDAKIQAVASAQRNRKKDPLEYVLIGGDAFNTADLAFEGVVGLKSRLAKLSAVGASHLVCGEVAGAINILNGVLALREGLHALHNNKKLAIRLFLDCVLSVLIGIVMIISSLALKGVIGAFFLTHPWLLALFFFVAALPITLEVAHRLREMRLKQDVGSQFTDNQIERVLRGLNESKDKDKYLSDLFEKYQANVGVEAAIEMFEAIKTPNNTRERITALAKAKVEIAKWKRAQKIRLIMQIIFFVAFGISMAAMARVGNGRLLDASQNFILSAGNVAALAMDWLSPFKRNTPLVVAPVESGSQTGAGNLYVAPPFAQPPAN